MLKNSLILVLTNEIGNKICDFVSKTCVCLAKNDNDVVLINIANSLSIKEIFASYKKDKKNWQFIREYNGYYQVSPLFLLPFRRFIWVFKLNLSINIIFIYLLFTLKHKKKYVKKVAWLFFPKFEYLLSTFKFLNFHIHFDIVDFFTSPDIIKNNKIQKLKEFFLKKADTVSVISHTLKEQYQKIYHRDIIVVPQGFSIDSFKTFKEINIKKNKPVIGFVGSINSRIDFNLMNNLVSRNLGWNFVFVGPKVIEKYVTTSNEIDERIEILFSKKNVFWIDSLPKKYIASIVDSFDVAIIPYDLKYDFNKFCFPMKLFEYLYMKKPIVSTPIEELKRFKDYVFLAETAKEWEVAIKKSLLLLSDKKDSLESYRKLALKNTWEEKIEAISKQIC